MRNGVRNSSCQSNGWFISQFRVRLWPGLSTWSIYEVLSSTCLGVLPRGGPHSEHTKAFTGIFPRPVRPKAYVAVSLGHPGNLRRHDDSGHVRTCPGPEVARAKATLTWLTILFVAPKRPRFGIFFLFENKFRNSGLANCQILAKLLRELVRCWSNKYEIVFLRLRFCFDFANCYSGNLAFRQLLSWHGMG